MWINKARVRSFYSIEDSGWLEFSRNVNLIVGANNSGKSALLRALAPDFPDQPHRSPKYDKAIATCVDLEIAISPEELFKRFDALGVLPIFPIKAESGVDLERLTSRVSGRSLLELQCTRNVAEGLKSRDGCAIEGERSRDQKYVTFSKNDLSLRFKEYVKGPDNLASFIDGDASSTIFYFAAERMRLSRSTFGREEKLDSDASNLAKVLAFLQGERLQLFSRIEKHLADIVPGIEGLSVRPQPEGFEILTWPEREKRDGRLAFSLADSGTGIAQLVAILTAVVTEIQSVIIIDEINTFLHPAAIKRLLLLLRTEYSNHQYIISTHSSDVISSADADVLYLVEKAGYSSNFVSVDRSDAAEVKRAGAILGFSMMDVFGYDHIIWVEGETEEVCFPQILRGFSVDVPSGTVFNRVYNTDPFGKERNAKTVADIYDYVQKRISPILQGYSFGLDREIRDVDYINSVEKKIGRLKFLPRRCIECYLINDKAIAALLNKFDIEVSNDEVLKWLMAHGGDGKYGASKFWKGSPYDREWLANVDAAKLISTCISELSQARLHFDKIKHNPLMFSTIMLNDHESIVELKDYIVELINISRR